MKLDKNRKIIFSVLGMVGIILLLCATIVTFWDCCNSSSELNKSDVIALISCWVSAFATFAVGIIAYLQGKWYKEESEQKERNVDVVVESVNVSVKTIPNNEMGRKCLPKDYSIIGEYRFILTLYSCISNPIFEITARNIKKDGSLLVAYERDGLMQKIQKDRIGKSFLCFGEKFSIAPEIPKTDNREGKYDICLTFQNQYGEIFAKNVSAYLKRNCIGDVAYVQDKSQIIQNRRKNVKGGKSQQTDLNT